MEGNKFFRVLPGDVWIWVHAGAGLAMLLCLLVHLAWHRDRIRAILNRAIRPKPGQSRRFSLEIWLAVIFLLVALSGAFIWCWLSHGWRHLHGAGALVFPGLAIRHLVRQRRLVVSLVRRNFR